MRSPKIDRPLDGLSMAEGIIGEGGIRDYDHLGCHPLHQTEVLKAIGVQSPMVSSISSQSDRSDGSRCIQDEAGDIGRKLT